MLKERVKEGDDINKLLKTPMNFLISIMQEENQNMSEEDEERVLDRFLDAI